jgi:D-arabinose 5-phosphate isomerase GutQ
LGEIAEEVICKKVAYINTINRNLGQVNEETLGKIVQTIRSGRRAILTAEGRSESGLLIGTKGVKKRTFAQNDSSFHWRNITEAAIDLDKKHGLTVLLVNSQSGSTTSPKEMVKDLRNFINRTGSKKFIICCVTAHPESEIAKNSDIVLQLKGSEEKEKKIQQSSGINEMMGDVFELGSTILFHGIKKGVNNGLSAKEILVIVKEEMKIIGGLVDNYLADPHYTEIVEEISRSPKIIFAGVGPDEEVAKMTATRTKHVVNVLGREAYIAGSLAPSPQPGVLIVLISWSGETKPVLDWRDKYNRGGATVFSIVGTAHSSLTENTRSYVLEAPVEEFYVRAAFLLSPLPGGVMENFRNRGIHIPEETIRALGHTKTE